MRINVIRAYADRETRFRVEAGSALDVTDARGTELVAKGFATLSAEKEERGGDECLQTSGVSAESRTEKKSKS